MDIKGFEIKFHGDNSVGIFDNTWNLTGYFNFETEEDLKNFKEKIKEAFEYCSDTPISVLTYDEIEGAELKLNIDN